MTLRVIGAGLGRTGTASLKVALETLGLDRCYHMTEVIKNPVSMQFWIDAANGNPDWDNIFQNYDATVDYPACSFCKELANYFPEAKIILTVRDANSWFESTSETILSPWFSAFVKNSPWGDMLRKTVWDTLDNRMDEREFMVPYFETRNQEIIDAFPSDRLLVYQVKEGWKPLCAFLDVPVPKTDFPRINSRKETIELFETMIAANGEGPSAEAMASGAKQLHAERTDQDR